MALLTLGDIEIFYEVHGQGDPLVLIHGLGSSSRDWEPQIGDFKQNFQVITLDLRGHGSSGKPPGPYSMPLFARDTAFLLEELSAYPANILGISLGGMVAFQLALDFPDLVKKLVIVNSVAELVPKNHRDVISYWQRLLIIRFFGMEKMGRVLANRFFTEPDQEALREVFIRRWSENHKPSYRAALKAAYGWSVVDRLGEICVPTLVVGADGDYFPTEDKEAYTALIQGAKLVVFENTKHALPAEKPEEFNQVVEGFLLK
jgi:pimeloyl-ACP methyl ester carboxylesterase